MKSAESFASDSQVHGLRVELSSRSSMVSPFDQFAFSELNGDSRDQRLRLVFATHEVLLRGAYLRRVEMAMQKRESSFVAKVSTDYQSKLVENQPTILEITVKEMQPAAGQPHKATDSKDYRFTQTILLTQAELFWNFMRIPLHAFPLRNRRRESTRVKKP